MSITAQQIRLLARYLANDEIARLYYIKEAQVDAAFIGTERPCVIERWRLPVDLERLELMDRATEASRGITDAQIVQLNRYIEDLNLSVRAMNCLTYNLNGTGPSLGLTFIWQLCELSEAELLKIRNFGRVSLNQVREVLAEIGLSFNMDLTSLKGRLHYPPPK